MENMRPTKKFIYKKVKPVKAKGWLIKHIIKSIKSTFEIIKEMEEEIYG